jgi:hypothetical protein
MAWRGIGTEWRYDKMASINSLQTITMEVTLLKSEHDSYILMRRLRGLCISCRLKYLQKPPRPAARLLNSWGLSQVWFACSNCLSRHRSFALFLYVLHLVHPIKRGLLMSSLESR